MRITSITYLSSLKELNPENDNIDVHIALDDGRQFTFTLATPIYDCVNSDLKPSSVSCCCGFVVLAWTREGVCNSR